MDFMYVNIEGTSLQEYNYIEWLKIIWNTIEEATRRPWLCIRKDARIMRDRVDLDFQFPAPARISDPDFKCGYSQWAVSTLPCKAKI